MCVVYIYAISPARNPWPVSIPGVTRSVVPSHPFLGTANGIIYQLDVRRSLYLYKAATPYYISFP